MNNEIGTVGSAARFGMNPTPIGAASLVGGALLGGKGGRGNPFRPEFKGGKNGQPVMVKTTRKSDWVPATPNMYGTNTPNGMIAPSETVARQLGTTMQKMQQSPYLDTRTAEQKIIARANAPSDPYAKFLAPKVPSLADLGTAAHRASYYNSGYNNYLKGLL